MSGVNSGEYFKVIYVGLLDLVGSGAINLSINGVLALSLGRVVEIALRGIEDDGQLDGRLGESHSKHSLFDSFFPSWICAAG